MNNVRDHSKFLKRGRNRHKYLRTILSRVFNLNDLEKTFVGELAKYLRKTFPNIRPQQKIFIQPEVTVLNRRPDFVIYIPNVALVLLEYKTSNTTLNIRSSYLKQTRDTMKKMKNCLPSPDANESTIKLLSLLLIRNSTTRRNCVVCVGSRNIKNKNYLL